MKNFFIFYGAAKPMSISVWLSRVHDYGLGRLHIHELVFDLLHRLQAKFLRFFGANHESTRIPQSRDEFSGNGATTELNSLVSPLARRYPGGFTFYLADPISSVAGMTQMARSALECVHCCAVLPARSATAQQSVVVSL
jgi:hypothetical protein